MPSRDDDPHAKLEESPELSELLFDEVPCYISVQDRDLRIIRSNRKFKEDFGDREGARCFELYKHRDEPCIICPVEATFDDGEIHYSEEVVTSMSGERINTLVSTSPIRNSEGEIVWVIEMSTNITQIRDLQQQLTNLGMLVGSISHGLKGLLTGLDGGMYMLNTGLDKDLKDRVDKGRQMVKRNVESIRQVVLDLLYIAGEDEPQFEPIALFDLSDRISRSLHKRAADLEIEFKIDLDKNVGICDVDPRALRGCLRNILSSAFESCRIDSRKESHCVHFELTSDGDNAVFRIVDNGIGMDRETRETMFSLSFTSKGAKGTGLMLFTANKVIEKHRGTIEVESEPRKGTIYRIRIPKVRKRND
ncbi:MAG: PAS domain-containing protein [Deltaproteobacteria bacterium]|nr:PAS domain-containing protein [Deltaproteobacteria bacterium]